MTVKEYMKNLIFPRICVNCKNSGDYLCKECRKKFQPHPDICPVCHKFSKDFLVCINCIQNKEIFYRGLIIGFRYNGEIKKLILGLKYYHHKDIGEFLAKRLYMLIQTNGELNNAENTILTYVPSHWIRKYFIKGYNQSEVLTKELSIQSNIPYYSICKKKLFTKAQTNLNKQKRENNLKGAFELISSTELKGNETIIIVDDITTTGSTINEVARTIKEVYPKCTIWGLVVGRHG